MDTDGYDSLDFVLGEPGLIEDTRIEDEAAATARTGADSDQAIQACLARFDRDRARAEPAVTCLIRFAAPAGNALATEVTARRILDRMQGALRSPDFCERTDRGDYALGLAGCDADVARKRVALMTRLVAMDPMFVQTMSLWAGIAPITGTGSLVSLRTAELACDLAAFQPSGHVEVIEL